LTHFSLPFSLIRLVPILSHLMTTVTASQTLTEKTILRRAFSGKDSKDNKWTCISSLRDYLSKLFALLFKRYPLDRFYSFQFISFPILRVLRVLLTFSWELKPGSYHSFSSLEFMKLMASFPLLFIPVNQAFSWPPLRLLRYIYLTSLLPMSYSLGP